MGEHASRDMSNLRYDVKLHSLDFLINDYQSVASLKYGKKGRGRFSEPMAAREIPVFSGMSDKAERFVKKKHSQRSS